MDRRLNPFNELYVSETIASEEFVKVFSPHILKNAHALFAPGNVVLKGMQGSGKSMLLSLLKPETRIAYSLQESRFPLSDSQSRFIGAGINLTRSGVIDFGQRAVSAKADELAALPIYFGDFLNYWIVYDLLMSVERYMDGVSTVIAKALQIRGDAESLDRFAIRLSQDPCWFGYLRDVRTYGELKKQLAARLSNYLAFLNFNQDKLPKDIEESKSTVGVPIAKAINSFYAERIVKQGVHFLIRIDQYEELLNLEGKRKELGKQYREVVNKALSLREPNISYRIGTRGYAWDEHPRIYGSKGYLERDRNFRVVDLDEILQRRENRKTWIFPGFANDVLAKRMALAGYKHIECDRCIQQLFGMGESPEDKAQRYAGQKSPQRAVRLDPTWPQNWQKFLSALTATNALSARLGEAWLRQQVRKKPGKARIDNHHAIHESDWISRKYWIKERVQAALMQIAGRCHERMLWCGATDIIELSGGNISVFVSVCQHVWAAYLRTLRSTDYEHTDEVPLIENSIQAVAIHEASEHWFTKLSEDSGGKTRQRFAAIAANDLERDLYHDDALSYPGANGFSLSEFELDGHVRLKSFLRECVDYGALVDSPHTTKSRRRERRWKWYLTPILSPYFKLPHVHTKEPAYLRSQVVLDWFAKAEIAVVAPVNTIKPSGDSVSSNQAELFPESNGHDD